jgi:hypothetical protein
MPRYRVVWEMEIDAADPRQAAATAFQVQRGQQVRAATFAVLSEDGERSSVDLEQPDLDLFETARTFERQRHLGHE